MDAIFQKVVANHFSDFRGTTVDASVPVPEYLINEIMQATLQGNKTLEACQVSIHAQNRAFLNLKTTLLPWILNLKLKLDNSVDFASYGSPKVRAWLENNRLLGSLGSLLHALPEGVKLYGNQVVIDLGEFLRTPEQKRLLAMVKSVGIRTEEGKAIFDLQIEIA